MKRIQLISGPRNLSTALMYSFGNRPDTDVVDEPMYAHYLRVSGVDHPGRDAVLKSMPSDIQVILDSLIFPTLQQPYYFIKNMAHHFIQVVPDFILKLDNVFLLRDPRQMIASFARVIPSPTIQDLGLEMEYRLFELARLKSQNAVVVVDSSQILADPAKALSALCEALHMPFSKRMLSWKAGPRQQDGVWAPYWYANVHRSTTFKKQKSSSQPLPAHLEPLYEEARSYYDAMAVHRLNL